MRSRAAGGQVEGQGASPKAVDEAEEGAFERMRKSAVEEGKMVF